jgi:hypothetical protein
MATALLNYTPNTHLALATAEKCKFIVVKSTEQLMQHPFIEFIYMAN